MLLEPTQSGRVEMMMRFFRHIAAVLILVLVSSPALATICAASCASQSVMSSYAQHASNASGKAHCHESPNKQGKNTQNSEHHFCVMGHACNFAQVISGVDSLSKYVYADTNNILFSRLAISDKSVDLPPPLKPPA